jgi:hypothetical protein
MLIAIIIDDYAYTRGTWHVYEILCEQPFVEAKIPERFTVVYNRNSGLAEFYVAGNPRRHASTGGLNRYMTISFDPNTNISDFFKSKSYQLIRNSGEIK